MDLTAQNVLEKRAVICAVAHLLKAKRPSLMEGRSSYHKSVCVNRSYIFRFIPAFERFYALLPVAPVSILYVLVFAHIAEKFKSIGVFCSFEI